MDFAGEKGPKLLNFINNFTDKDVDKKIAFDRIAQQAGNDVAIRVVFKLPILPHCRTIREFCIEELKRQLQSLMRKGRAVVINIGSEKQTSILRSLKHLSDWCKDINKREFPCTCQRLRSLLDIPDGVKFTEHVCIRNVDAALVQTIPANCNVQSNVVPSSGRVEFMLRKEIERISVKVRKNLVQNLDFKPFLEAADAVFYEFHGFQDMGVRCQDLHGWKSALSHHAIIAEIDKNKSQCS